MHPDNVYEDIQSAEKLKKFMMDQLNDYNNTPKSVRMNLVLFRDAIEHSMCDLLIRS